MEPLLTMAFEYQFATVPNFPQRRGLLAFGGILATKPPHQLRLSPLEKVFRKYCFTRGLAWKGVSCTGWVWPTKPRLCVHFFKPLNQWLVSVSRAHWASPLQLEMGSHLARNNHPIEILWVKGWGFSFPWKLTKPSPWKLGFCRWHFLDGLHPGRLTAGTYKSPMKRKENDLNQTSRELWSIFIFQDVIFLILQLSPRSPQFPRNRLQQLHPSKVLIQRWSPNFRPIFDGVVVPQLFLAGPKMVGLLKGHWNKGLASKYDYRII